MRILIMGAATTDGYSSIGINRSIAGGGWVENLIQAIKNESSIEELHVAFYTDGIGAIAHGKMNGVFYHGLPAWIRNLRDCNPRMIADLEALVQHVKPDVLHIIGTECRFAYELARIVGMKKTVISLTGMVSVIEKHYLAGIDKAAFIYPSIGDIIRRGGPILEQKRFCQQGYYERKLLQEAKYVLGRTTWDYACVKQINPDIEYTYCGELLNPCYSEQQWDINKRQKYRIFISQGGYPLKGFHKFLDALPYLLSKYPDCTVYVAGPNLLNIHGLMGRIKQTTYSKYIKRKIKKLAIPSKCIRFTGTLDAKGMLQQYLACNVFVLPSAIENSPNSLGEAMNLGVPCVSSCVGGVQDMMRDRIDGFIYPYDEPYMMAHYIGRFFESDDLCLQMGQNARENAAIRFNQYEVVRSTMQVYRNIHESL